VIVRGQNVDGTEYAYEAHKPEPDSPQERLGAALLALRKRAPKAPLSKLYDKHRAELERL
jgi:hypothetical protein